MFDVILPAVPGLLFETMKLELTCFWWPQCAVIFDSAGSIGDILIDALFVLLPYELESAAVIIDLLFM
jgi:hypothetical protein